MNEPLASTDRLSPPLFCRTRPLPARPLTVPPIVKRSVAQVICTLVTFPLAVPVPNSTLQVWLGTAGWVRTETE